MLSKNKIKYIHSLSVKKIRNEEGLFVAEGNKIVADMLPYFDCELLVAAPQWLETHKSDAKEIVVAEGDDIQKASFLKTPQDVLALFRIPDSSLEAIHPNRELILALDGIQNPGNLGTIIRLADWFGIEHIVCSHDTADVFSPKVVQATMGALAHTQICYTDLLSWLKIQTEQGIPVYGTFLDGQNMYEKELNKTGIIVMGNEGNGIRPEVGSLIKERLYIPHPEGRVTSESLNVAIATAVVCAEFRRRNYTHTK